MKKNAPHPKPELDVECVEVGDPIRWWDNRISGWRIGRVQAITDKFFKLITGGKLRKVPKDDLLYLMKGRFDVTRKLVETPE